MALNQQGYAVYANNKVMTASPAQLILMLYEGAIKFTNIAIEAVDAGDIEKASTNIIKVENIISELQASLDRKYPVAQDFDNVYVYVKRRLVEANVSKDKEILEEILTHMRTMRDTWKEVMQKANAQ